MACVRLSLVSLFAKLSHAPCRCFSFFLFACRIVVRLFFFFFIYWFMTSKLYSWAPKSALFLELARKTLGQRRSVFLCKTKQTNKTCRGKTEVFGKWNAAKLKFLYTCSVIFLGRFGDSDHFLFFFQFRPRGACSCTLRNIVRVPSRQDHFFFDDACAKVTSRDAHPSVTRFLSLPPEAHVAPLVSVFLNSRMKAATTRSKFVILRCLIKVGPVLYQHWLNARDDAWLVST